MSTAWVIAYAVLVAVVAMLGVVVIGILQRILPLIDRSSAAPPDFGGLSVLSRVPPIDLVDDEGGIFAFPADISETTVVLLMESTCAPCREIGAALTRRQRTVIDLPLVAILDDAAEAQSFPLPSDVRLLFGERPRIIDAFATAATPFAFVLGVGGVVLERRVVGGLDDLRLLALHQKGGDLSREHEREPPIWERSNV